MIFGYILLLVALTISAVAAFYSIAGLTAIFAAAFWPIVIMGTVLELGKIISTVWLHKYWDKVALQFKLYLVPAIVILMLITSMGIFGLLSKAHLDQAVPAGDISSQVQILDEKILTERENIDAARKALAQMNSQVDAKLLRTDNDKGAERAVQIRRGQAKERKQLQNDIASAQKTIAALQAERAPIASQARKVESEVGPIKYIAALIYGDNPDQNVLEKSVRLVIILLVLVFDPLALVLILAADQTFEWHRPRKKLPYELDDGPLTDEQLDKIKKEANVDDDIEMQKFFDNGKELAKSIDDNNGYLPDGYAKTQSYLQSDWAWSIPELNTPKEGWVPNTTVENDPLDIPILDGEEMWAQEAIDTNPKFDPPPVNHRPPPATDEDPINPIIKPIAIPDFSIAAESTNPINAGFGTIFPNQPLKGDMFLRVDYLPSRLYKWNDKKWIEVNKEQSDNFAYDEAYIKHLIEKLDSGEYDVDLLTATEQEQIQRYIENGKSKQ